MARKRTKPTVKQAQTLLDWLITLDLPTRVINALRRDLEVVTGQREGGPGSGVLAGFDQAQFTEELYRASGGQVGQVPSVAKSAIEALRAVIPAPASADDAAALDGEETPPGPAEAAPEAAAPPDLADTAPEAVPAEAEAAPEGAAPPDLADTAPEAVPADAEATPEAAALPADAAPEAALEVAAPPAPADTAPEAAAPPVPAEAAPASADAPVPPKRGRGRPPRATAAPEAAPEPVDAPAAPPKRRGRPPRGEAAPAAPALALNAEQRTPRAPQPAAPRVEAPVRTLAAPVEPPQADPSFAALLRLWQELHPQGRRAATHYMASLVHEG